MIDRVEDDHLLAENRDRDDISYKIVNKTRSIQSSNSDLPHFLPHSAKVSHSCDAGISSKFWRRGILGGPGGRGTDFLLHNDLLSTVTAKARIAALVHEKTPDIIAALFLVRVFE